MTDVEREGNVGGPANPKQGAGSGVTKSNSTTTDEGPVTTRATSEGDPIVTEKGETAKLPPTEERDSEE